MRICGCCLCAQISDPGHHASYYMSDHILYSYNCTCTHKCHDINTLLYYSSVFPTSYRASTSFLINAVLISSESLFSLSPCVRQKAGSQYKPDTKVCPYCLSTRYMVSSHNLRIWWPFCVLIFQQHFNNQAALLFCNKLSPSTFLPFFLSSFLSSILLIIKFHSLLCDCKETFHAIAFSIPKCESKQTNLRHP